MIIIIITIIIIAIIIQQRVDKGIVRLIIIVDRSVIKTSK